MKYLNTILIAGMLLTNLTTFADTPQPYSSIQNLPATPYYVLDGYTYYALIQSRNAAVVIDVESQDGGVARYIAQQAANLPSLQTVYSVNSWTSSDQANKHLFQRFLSNVKQDNTTNMIVPIRMSSSDAASGLNVKADFISLVGANDKDIIYRDILAWFPHLTDGGVLCGNNWLEPSIEIGVTKAAEALDLTLHVNNNVWYLERSAI